MSNSVSKESLEGFILKKGEDYPKGCFDPRKDMQSSYLHRGGDKIKPSSSRPSGGGGKKVFSRSVIKR